MSKKMFALTVSEPFASLIMRVPDPILRKTVENRDWATPHRGTLWIHSGKGSKYLNIKGPADPWQAAWAEYRRRYPELAAEPVFGALLGCVDLVDCLDVAAHGHRPPLLGNRHAEGPFCWVLANPRPLPEPIPLRGARKLWPLPAELRELLAAHAQTPTA